MKKRKERTFRTRLIENKKPFKKFFTWLFVWNGFTLNSAFGIGEII